MLEKYVENMPGKYKENVAGKQSAYRDKKGLRRW